LTGLIQNSETTFILILEKPLKRRLGAFYKTFSQSNLTPHFVCRVPLFLPMNPR
jgi:hypothetical protein